MNNFVYIYKLYDPKYPEIIRYIGKTERSDIKLRLNEHVCSSKRKEYRVSRWINKVILDNRRPSIELVDTCKKEDWEEKEKFYINLYKTKYLTNIENGGRSETLRKYNKVGTDKNAKPIVQLDMNFNFIKRFNSVSEAARKLNYTGNVIGAACKGIQTKAYGYRWKFEEDATVRKPYHKKSKCVCMLDKEGNLLNEFPSIKEASLKTGLKYPSISNCLHNKVNSLKGYIFKFKNN